MPNICDTNLEQEAFIKSLKAYTITVPKLKRALEYVKNTRPAYEEDPIAI